MKLRYSLLLATSLAAAAATASAADGTINFQGAVTGSTCVVTPGTAGATVSLPTVSEAGFTGVGSTTARTLFNISLSGCSTGAAQARAFFEANSDLVDYPSNSLKNTDSTAGAASGVGFALFEGDTRIKIGNFNDHGTTSRPIVANGVILPYEVSYVQTAAEVEAGTVKGQVQFSIHYN